MLSRYTKSALFTFRNTAALKIIQNGFKFSLKPRVYFCALQTKLSNNLDMDYSSSIKRESMTISESINKFVRYCQFCTKINLY